MTSVMSWSSIRGSHDRTKCVDVTLAPQTSSWTFSDWTLQFFLPCRMVLSSSTRVAIVGVFTTTTVQEEDDEIACHEIMRIRLLERSRICCFLASLSCQSFFGRRNYALFTQGFETNAGSRMVGYSKQSSRLFSSQQDRNNHHRHVCVLHNDDEEEYDNTFHTICKQLADSLSLSLMTKSQLIHKQQLTSGEEDDLDSQSLFTHALCVVNYSEGSNMSQNVSDQYAVSIQPLLQAQTDFLSNPKRRQKSSSKTKIFSTKPYWIDFCPPTPTKRSGQPDLLLQAVAPHRVYSHPSSSQGDAGGGATIYDLTAGWGQDSLLLALGGASKVHMIERDPIVACLLQDALRRLNYISNSAPSSWQERATQLTQKLSLQVGDAREVLQDLVAGAAEEREVEQLPDILYLDPMFPPRTKSAAVKKGMQILHGLFQTTPSTSGDDSESELSREIEEAELLKLAHSVARVKVVVKRPIHAPRLGGEVSDVIPSNTIKGSINRWDIYAK